MAPRLLTHASYRSQMLPPPADDEAGIGNGIRDVSRQLDGHEVLVAMQHQGRDAELPQLGEQVVGVDEPGLLLGSTAGRSYIRGAGRGGGAVKLYRAITSGSQSGSA